MFVNEQKETITLIALISTFLDTIFMYVFKYSLLLNVDLYFILLVTKEIISE